jgi:hypothetical protein
MNMDTQQQTKRHVEHLPAIVRVSPRGIKRDLATVDSFNGKAAIVLTSVVGTMWAFWVFNGIALVSLPSAIQSGNLTILIAWVSSNWLQLILLPALLVGQRLQAVASDTRTAKQFADTEVIMDRVDHTTEGGVKAVLDEVTRVGASVAELHGKLDAKKAPRKLR